MEFPGMLSDTSCYTTIQFPDHYGAGRYARAQTLPWRHGFTRSSLPSTTKPGPDGVRFASYGTIDPGIHCPPWPV